MTTVFVGYPTPRGFSFDQRPVGKPCRVRGGTGEDVGEYRIDRHTLSLCKNGTDSETIKPNTISLVTLVDLLSLRVREVVERMTDCHYSTLSVL